MHPILDEQSLEELNTLVNEGYPLEEEDIEQLRYQFTLE